MPCGGVLGGAPTSFANQAMADRDGLRAVGLYLVAAATISLALLANR